MSTKCIVIGQNETIKKELKKIEFTKALCLNINLNNSLISNAECSPCHFDNVELIQKRLNGICVMLAYNDNNREGGMIYLGHWNDGIV